MSVKISNNATSTLAANITSGATTLSVASGDGAKWPTLGAGDWCPTTIVDSSGNRETVKVTAIAGDVLTVSRGQENTVATAFSAGARVSLNFTGAVLVELEADIAAINTTMATLAAIASPALTGTPTAPTPAANDDSTKIATTAFVAGTMENGFTDPGTGTVYAGVPSSTVVFTIKQTAPAGWLMFADQTIGDGSSGAAYANADALNVFTDLYALTDADCPVLTSGGAATTRSALGDAAAAWAAHARMTMPKTLGRALAVAGAGSGLTARAAGDAVGEETHTLLVAEAPTGLHTLNEPSGGHSHTPANGSGVFMTSGGTSGLGNLNAGTNLGQSVGTAKSVTGITLTDNAGGGAHNNIQPTAFLNAMIKK